MLGTKRLPRNLASCVQVDPTTKKLLAWADGIVVVGLIGFIFFIIATVISMGLMLNALIGSYEAIVVFFPCFFALLTLTVVEFFAYQLASLLLEALANVVYNTHVSASVALYERREQEITAAAEAKENQNT